MKNIKKILIVLFIIILNFSLYNYSYATTLEQEITKNDNWEKTFTIPKYDENGKMIKYEAEEINIPENYEETSSIEDNEIIITNSLKICEYRVEYYYDGEIDDNLTFREVANLGTIIEGYEYKPKDGYYFYKVEGENLKVTENNEDNVIKVYYTSLPLTGGNGISNFIILGTIFSTLGIIIFIKNLLEKRLKSF